MEESASPLGLQSTTRARLSGLLSSTTAQTSSDSCQLRASFRTTKNSTMSLTKSDDVDEEDEEEEEEDEEEQEEEDEEEQEQTNGGDEMASLASNQVEMIGLEAASKTSFAKRLDNDGPTSDKHTRKDVNKCLGEPAGSGSCFGESEITLEAEEEKHDRKSQQHLMQIVESAQLKLLRSELKQHGAAGLTAAQWKTRTPMLLKSPAFAKNTLDQSELDKLASCDNVASSGNSGSLLLSSPIALAFGGGQREQQQQQQDKRQGEEEKAEAITCQPTTAGELVTDCSRKWSSGDSKPPEDMTNRHCSSDGLLQGHWTDNDPSMGLPEPRCSDEDEYHLLDHDNDYEAGERGGPTPTNDLIRVMLERDRRALVSSFKERRGKVEIDAPTKTATTKPGDKAKEMRFDCKVDELRRRSVLSDLSSLISKCQRQMQVSPSRSIVPQAGPGHARLLADHFRANSPRKPSDPTALVSRHLQVLESQQEASSQLRRHSAYVSPLQSRFSHLAVGSSSSSSSSLDDDDELAFHNEPPPSQSQETASSRACRRDKLDSELAGRRNLAARASSSSNNNNNPNLPSSASSPSALSTPTNENGGCGGACCSQQAQLVKLAAENAALSRELFLSSSRSFGMAPAVTRPAQQELMQPTGSSRLADQGAGKPSVATAKQPASKRHSIMSIFGHGQLANRRLQDGEQGKVRHRDSLAGPLTWPDSEQTAYDPLIPESGFKIVVMGTSGSGKTSIIQRFMYNSFSWRHQPTVEDTYFIEFPYMKNLINISISDTSGTYQFPAMRRLAINSGDAFILVFSVDDPQSFDDLEQLRQTILDEREQAYLDSITSSSSELASGQSQISIASASATQTNNKQPTPCNTKSTAEHQYSPGRHWSLASLFRHHDHTHSSLNSSMSSSASSSTDTSRRSSISAAEAALKTRRTRRPPMVIVANKYDLPPEQHLVNSDEIEALAVIDWNNGFVRASAATNSNVNEIFQQVLKQARQPPTLTEAIVSKRRRSLPPKLLHV